MKWLIFNLVLILSPLLCFAQSLQQGGLQSEFLYNIDVTVDTSIHIGKTFAGDRTLYRVNGGYFEGPRLKGRVLPSGGDYAVRLDSSTMRLEVRIILKTDDGALIYNTYNGYIHDNPDGTKYWKVCNFYETASKKYNWLNHIIAVGIAKTNNRAWYDVYEIK